MIKGNETKTFRLSGFQYADRLYQGFIAVIALHCLFSLAFKIEYIIWLVVPLFLIYIYYYTIGRNQYLKIAEKLDLE